MQLAPTHLIISFLSIASAGLDGLGQGVGGRGSDGSNERCLDRAQKRAVAREVALHVAEEEQRCQRHANGGKHGLPGGGDEDVGQQGHRAAHHVGQGDRERAL